jgi:serine/threonine protein kinase/DNA-binding CsgD family transcriptional regulator
VAALRHPNIVQVFDFDMIDGRPYIVMELIEGPSLSDYLDTLHQAQHVLPPETTVRLIVSLAAALDYAHGRGIVHRDVKPANVLLRREGPGQLDPNVALPLDVEPVLTDFGVAHIASAAMQTASGTIMGTPVYISPEQVRGEAVDARADIYSLGVMLYEMLAGKPPFDPETESTASLLIKHITAAPPPLLNVSPAVQAVLDRALAKDRAERYPKAGDLAADLLVGVFGKIEPRPSPGGASLLGGLIDTLDLLAAQVRAYERALPPNNYPARAVVATLGELARQALAEARDLATSLAPPPPAAAHPFSPRELEVLTLAAQGLTNKEIAYRLGISERTVQFHMNSIFNKSTTSSRTEAVALALQKGWIT